MADAVTRLRTYLSTLNKHDLLELLRYGLVGFATAVAYFFVAMSLDKVGLPSWASVGTARTSAFLLAYYGHLRFTFNVRAPEHSRMLSKFLASRALSVFFSFIITYLLHDLAGQPFWLTALVVIVVTPILNWPIGKLWVFRARDTRPA